MFHLKPCLGSPHITSRRAIGISSNETILASVLKRSGMRRAAADGHRNAPGRRAARTGRQTRSTHQTGITTIYRRTLSQRDKPQRDNVWCGQAAGTVLPNEVVETTLPQILFYGLVRPVFIPSRRLVVTLLKKGREVVVIVHRLDYAARPRGGRWRAAWRTLRKSQASCHARCIIVVRIPAIAITCSDASRSGIPIDREQCGAGA